MAALEAATFPPDDIYEARARFCLALGVAPSEYDQMLADEVQLWIDTYNEMRE